MSIFQGWYLPIPGCFASWYTKARVELPFMAKKLSKGANYMQRQRKYINSFFKNSFTNVIFSILWQDKPSFLKIRVHYSFKSTLLVRSFTWIHTKILKISIVTEHIVVISEQFQSAQLSVSFWKWWTKDNFTTHYVKLSFSSSWN